jgi:hypothetical protein
MEHNATKTQPLAPLIGEWSMKADFPSIPDTGVRGRVAFEWLPGEQFVVERWEVPVPEAPDGIAIIGFDEERGNFRQHYFDSRGVHRVYEMSLEDGEWKLWRDAPGFSQRFTGRFSEDGSRIDGAWEQSADGSTWEHDFDLTYTRV